MEIQPLRYQKLDGISERQLTEHHDVLYVGYVIKIDEIREKLEMASEADANHTYSEIRELKIEESFALNGVKLHELYFDNLGGDGSMREEIKDKIEADFGTLEVWMEDFFASAMSARGWAMLCLDKKDMKLHNYIADTHNLGIVTEAVPLLVLDVYEHAYFIDYGTKKKDYIEAFMRNVDWEVVQKRYNDNIS